MLGVWTAQGYPGYPWDNPGQHIMYISTLGATGWGKPLFITGSAVMVVLFNATFCMERWFRHKGRLTMNYNITEKILSGFAIAFALIGGASLIQKLARRMRCSRQCMPRRWYSAQMKIAEMM